MNKTEKKTFKPRARMLIQLGDQLIKSENIAIIELVKNSYDADAKSVDINFNHIDDQESGYIEIIDTGLGMTEDVVNNVWLEPGADFKDLLLKGNQFSLGFEYDEPKRKPIGEKGVGRFGVHKLGNSIEMITKSKKSTNEIVVKIDWEQFENEKYVEDAKFDVTVREPEVFTMGETGTKLIIKNLRNSWDYYMFRELTRSINSLNSPFETEDSFTVDINLLLKDEDKTKKWEENVLKIDDMKEKSLWKIEAKIKGDKILEFDYEFIPYSAMDKLQGRKLSIKDIPMMKKVGNKEEIIDLGKHEIGVVTFKGYIYDLSSKILKLGSIDPKYFKEYLGDNGGVRVYREGLRVYDYGEPGDDWLDLDRQRINTPAKKIGNKNILGFIGLKREFSRDLKEKTNREGFVENEAYNIFRDSIDFLIEMIGQERNIDKAIIREVYEGKSQYEPVSRELGELRDIIDENFSNEKTLEGYDKQKLQKELLVSIEKIERKYEEVNNILLKSAGSGRSLGIALHEIEKRIKELHSGLKSGDMKNFDIVLESITNILTLIEGYAKLLTSSNKKDVKLVDVINQSVFGSEFRFKAHKVEVVKEYLNKGMNNTINCVENITIGVLLNIFDNSIYWLEKYNIGNKKIYIDVLEYKDSLGVVICDNGYGLSLDPELAVKPFITKKLGGMGLGLYISDEMMNSIKGSLNIRDYRDLEGKIPEEYKDGAIIELLFPKQ